MSGVEAIMTVIFDSGRQPYLDGELRKIATYGGKERGGMDGTNPNRPSKALTLNRNNTSKGASDRNIEEINMRGNVTG